VLALGKDDAALRQQARNKRTIRRKLAYQRRLNALQPRAQESTSKR
jgi:hypothetical protein